jgi:hypothetical protein
MYSTFWALKGTKHTGEVPLSNFKIDTKIVLRTENGTLLFNLVSSDCGQTVYDRIFCDVPAKNTVYTAYTYCSGQP